MLGARNRLDHQKSATFCSPLTANCLSWSAFWWWRWARNNRGHRQFSSHHFISVWQGRQVHHCNWMAPTSSSAHTGTRDEYNAHKNTMCVHTYITDMVSSACESSDNHPVRDTKSRQWLAGLTFMPTHTANHFTHNSPSSAGALIQISSSLPQTHNNNFDRH